MNLAAKSVSESVVQSTEMVLPPDTNSLGNLFGGTLVSWVDRAAAVCAQRHSNRPVVTASIDDLHFISPVSLGWVVSIWASVNFVGRTSMEVGVRVDAENTTTQECVHAVTAYFTFVALGDGREPVPVPPLIVETVEEQRRFKEAQQRRQWRLERRAFFNKNNVK